MERKREAEKNSGVKKKVKKKKNPVLESLKNDINSSFKLSWVKRIVSIIPTHSSLTDHESM